VRGRKKKMPKFDLFKGTMMNVRWAMPIHFPTMQQIYPSLLFYWFAKGKAKLQKYKILWTSFHFSSLLIPYLFIQLFQSLRILRPGPIFIPF
jgi:hypothetical protein